MSILTEEVDLCEIIRQVGLLCPLKTGPHTASITVDLPDDLPSVSYNNHGQHNEYIIMISINNYLLQCVGLPYTLGASSESFVMWCEAITL